MERELGCEREDLIFKILNNFGEESIKYWLCAGQPL